MSQQYAAVLKRHHLRVLSSLVIAVLTLASGAITTPFAADPAGAADWHFETLDGDGTAPDGRVLGTVGEHASVTLYGGHPHAWYHDDSKGDLRHAWWTGTAWRYETLDGHWYDPDGRIDSDVGWDTRASLYGGVPHVWYRDAANEDLRHAWWTGTKWMFETLDGHTNGPDGRIVADVGRMTASTPHGSQFHVWYFDLGNGDLRHAWWTGTRWMFETLDGHQTGPDGRIDAYVGQFNSVTLYGGHPHVWYWDASPNFDLRHAWWTGTKWLFETLDGVAGPFGRTDNAVGLHTSVALYGGHPHVWYLDWTTADLRHAWWTGTTWWFETLDGHVPTPAGTVDAWLGYYTAATLYAGRPHVLYYDSTNGDLRHAWYS